MVATIPPYFATAGRSNPQNLITTAKPDPCRSTIGTVRCKFSGRLSVLTIAFEYPDVADVLKEAVFTIGNFNNPITESTGGFEVEMLDAEEYLIAHTKSDLFLTGIDEPAKFKSWDFNFVNTAASG